MDLLKSTERTLERGEKAKKRNEGNAKSRKTSGEEQKWSVLKDDFMMGARARDWNKPESDSEEDDGWNFTGTVPDNDEDFDL